MPYHYFHLNLRTIKLKFRAKNILQYYNLYIPTRTLCHRGPVRQSAEFSRRTCVNELMVVLDSWKLVKSADVIHSWQNIADPRTQRQAEKQEKHMRINETHDPEKNMLSLLVKSWSSCYFTDISHVILIVCNAHHGCGWISHKLYHTLYFVRVIKSNKITNCDNIINIYIYII